MNSLFNFTFSNKFEDIFCTSSKKNFSNFIISIESNLLLQYLLKLIQIINNLCFSIHLLIKCVF